MALCLSANLGFLWRELALPDAIRAAGAAGFDAVEFHEPYDFEVGALSDAIDQTGLQVISLNTRMGGRADDFGLAGQPGREEEAREAIVEAVVYARAIGCQNISVLVGCGERTGAADSTLIENLKYATGLTQGTEIGVLLEPINTTTVPGYYVSRIEHGLELIEAVDQSAKLMIDCFHTSIMEGDVRPAITSHLHQVGHIQIASIPDRHEPDTGNLDYPQLFDDIHQLGSYDGAYGAEYNPHGAVEDGLAWLEQWRSLGGHNESRI